MAITSRWRGTDQQVAAEVAVLPWRIVAAVAAGTLLNPLNSSMIAVALLTLGAHFHVATATATWLISSFYLAAAIGMPVMGRLADRFGPRRMFLAGLHAVAAILAAISALLLLAAAREERDGSNHGRSGS